MLRLELKQNSILIGLGIGLIIIVIILIISTNRTSKVRRLVSRQYGSVDVVGPYTVEHVELLVNDINELNPKDVQYQLLKSINLQKSGWVTLKRLYKDGDGVYLFGPKKSVFQSMSGVSGYVLIRKNKIIWKHLTRIQ